MHTDETKNKFIELRAQGWSLPKISEHLAVPVPTLGHWNIQHRAHIQQLRLAALAQAEEHILGSCTAQAEFLAGCVKAIDQHLAERIQSGELLGFNVRDLILMSGRLRGQLARIHPRLPYDEPTSEPEAKPQTEAI